MSNDSWDEYGKLVLKELERLNDVQEKTKDDIDTKFNELNTKLEDKLSEINIKLTAINNHETTIKTHNDWMTKVNEVWSPTQMKEGKDQIYKQKGRWIAAIAVIGVIQILIGIGITLLVKFL